MNVTINTDASFEPNFKYGSYAFWIVSNGFRITKSGVFKEKCINSNEAEVKCIINALKTLLKSNELVNKIIINTDSLNAISILQKNIRYIRKNKTMWEDLISVYDKVLGLNKNELVIEFRHVKAHSKINDKRSYVNKWCDKQAKNELRAIMSNIKKENESHN